MPNKDLIQYIQLQLSQKTDVTTIRRNLIQAGYKLNDIDQTIGEVIKEKTNQQERQQQQFLQQQQGRQQQEKQQQENPIISYVKQFLQKGYSLQDIRTYLLRYYPQQSVDPIIYDFLRKEKKKKQNKIIFFVLFIIIVLVISGILIKYIPAYVTTENSETIKFSYYLQQNTIQQGSQLSYTLQNIPTKREKKIYIKYKITEKESNKEVESWNKTYDETAEIETMHKYLISADFNEGDYKLIITIIYGKIIEEDKHNFRIISKTAEESCFDGIKNQNEEEIDCNGICVRKCYKAIEKTEQEINDIKEIDEIEKEKNKNEQKIEEEMKKDNDQKQQETGKITESDIMKDNKLMQEAMSKASVNSEEAYNSCLKIISKTTNEDCLFEVAKESNTTSYCRDIQTDNERDSCYMYFVTNNNEYICEEIINEEFKNICMSLKDLNQYKKMQEIAKEQGTMPQYGNFTIIEEVKPSELIKLNLTSPKIVLNDIITNQINNSAVEVIWKTNVLGDSLVIYGVNENLLDKQGYNNAPVYSHRIIITDLIPQTTYYLLINSSNPLKSVESELYSFII